MPDKPHTYYIEQFKGYRCFCGDLKESRQAFCTWCYRSLPAQMKKDLYQKFFDGYQEAVDVAERWLT